MKSLDHFKEEFAEEHVCVVREEGRRLPTIVRSLPHSVLSVGPYDHTANCLQFVRNISHTKTRHEIYL